MPRIRPRAALVAIAAAGFLVASVAPATALVANSWQISLKVTGSNFPEFSAVAAVSATSAWAFEDTGSVPAAYQLSGSTWTKRTFPAVSGDVVFDASASSPGNVWAVTFKGWVLRYNGSSWSKVKHFSQPVSSVLAISSTNVWVFGEGFAPNLGTWHYNGSTWTKSSSGSGLTDASASSASNVWGAAGTDVAHLSGGSWKKTSVKSLLPKNTELSHSFVAAVYAASSTSVYAVASGGRQDEGGPMVLLHYNGHKWSKVASGSQSLGGPLGVVPDGTGGLWIPIGSGAPVESSMEHYTGGALHAVTLPYKPAHLSLLGVSNATGSTAAVTVGFYRKSFSSNTSTAVILRFGS